VTDTSNFLSAETVQSLDARLAAYERASGRQILVYIGTTTGNAPIEDWAVRAFEAWRVGRAGIDDGLVLFIMPQDRRLRIEVGYGLEGQVPDSIASRVINEVIVPRIQAGNPDAAVAAGVDALINVLGGETALPQTTPEASRSRPLTLWQLIAYAVIGIVLLAIFVTNPSLAIYLLASVLAGGDRRRGGFGGGGFGGGGFRGGGGRSGGGGASGSW
jgi:uncharacterized protein